MISPHSIIFGLCLIASLLRNNASNGALLSSSPSIKVERNNNTADLTLLINETLAINNKTLQENVDKSSLIKDDWTFDRVEYDLMEFLQDLGARYQLQANKTANNNVKPDDVHYEDQLSGRSDRNATTPNKLKTMEQIAPTKAASELPKASYPTPVPNMSTSLASADHEIAESSWQYGIFDRFTRPKSTSTTPAPPEPPMRLDENGKIDMRNFNHDECGLRVYDDRPALYPGQFDNSETSDAIKDLSQRRQRLPPTPMTAHKKQQASNLADTLSSIGNDFGADLDSNTDRNTYDSYPSANDEQSEFNLASRRHWLQQQLGSTLQMLGFNASSHPTMSGEYFNDNSTLGFIRRENMMKMSSNKVGKSVDLGEASTNASPSTAGSLTIDDPVAAAQVEKLAGRQDELKLEARVIGGSDARLGDSPWSVSLQALVSRPGTGGVEYRHYCGGTIISEYYVLTAAHCLDFMVGRESRLFVVIGDLNWRMSTASLYGRRFGIDKLIIHSGYKSTAFGHDIGLIRVKESMKPLKVKGRYIINSVCLPERGVEHTGEAELVGWGLFSNRNEMADSLQIAEVPILPRPLCVDLYKRRTGLIQWLIGVELITEKQVCAGTFGRGICQGDSGSALVFNRKLPQREARQRHKLRTSHNEETRATIIGIVAFGGIRRCSYQSLPGVYMQTSKYMDWIVPRIQADTGVF